jgi:hypothetical protein
MGIVGVLGAVKAAWQAATLAERERLRPYIQCFDWCETKKERDRGPCNCGRKEVMEVGE